MSDDTFTVEVKRTESDKLGVTVLYGEDQKKAEESSSEEPSKTAVFSKLSSDWTSTAIGFFEVVPWISEAGFVIADHDLQENTLGTVRDLADAVETEVDGDITYERYRISMRESQRVAKSLGKTSQLLKTAAVMRRSALTALVSEYEAFMADLLALAISIRPEVFIDDEARISLKDIADYSSLEELKEAHIKQRLEDFLHKSSHKQVLQWIGEKFGVNLLSDTKLVAEFVEVCQRRHLISHAGSKVNKRYIRICKESGCRDDQILSLGESVAIDRKYLRRATARVYQVGFFTLHLLWQKLLADTEGSDRSVLACSHDFLENDLTKMARRLTHFSLSRKKDRPHNRTHAYLVINEAQSHKFDPELEDEVKAKSVEEALSQRDWSDSSPIVDLVLACLRNEFEDIGSLVDAAATVGKHKLTYPDVFTYNVFREARENPAFMGAVAETFGYVWELALARHNEAPA